jgi:hypothetical protein
MSKPILADPNADLYVDSKADSQLEQQTQVKTNRALERCLLNREVKKDFPVGTLINEPNGSKGVGVIISYYADKADLKVAIAYENLPISKISAAYLKDNYQKVADTSGYDDFIKEEVSKCNFKSRIIELVAKVREDRKENGDDPQIPYLNNNDSKRNSLFNTIIEKANLAGGYDQLSDSTLIHYINEAFPLSAARDHLEKNASPEEPRVHYANSRERPKNENGYHLFDPPNEIINILGPDDEPIQVVSSKYVLERLIAKYQSSENDVVEEGASKLWCQKNLSALNLHGVMKLADDKYNPCNLYRLTDVIRALENKPLRASVPVANKDGSVSIKINDSELTAVIISEYCKTINIDPSNLKMLLSKFGIKPIEHAEARMPGSKKVHTNLYSLSDVKKLEYLICKTGLEALDLPKVQQDGSVSRGKACTLLQYCAKNSISESIYNLRIKLKSADISPIRQTELGTTAEATKPRSYGSSVEIAAFNESLPSNVNQTRLIATNLAGEMLIHTTGVSSTDTDLVYWQSDLDKYFNRS